MQSLIAKTIFYCYGFGLFTMTIRIGIVFGVYFLQILFCPFCMRHFRFGPVEWLWRSLTCMRPQRLMRAKTNAVEPVRAL